MIIVLAGLQAGCAMKYQDAAGRLHIIGFTAMTVTPASQPAEGAAAVETRNVGVMVYASAATRGVSVGYNTESVLYPQRTAPEETPPKPALPSQ